MPIALGIVASYLRERIPANSIFCGEVDLTGRVRSPGHLIIEWLGMMIETQDEDFLSKFSKLYVSSDVKTDLEEILEQSDADIQINPVENILSLFKELWLI